MTVQASVEVTRQETAIAVRQKKPKKAKKPKAMVDDQANGDGQDKVAVADGTAEGTTEVKLTVAAPKKKKNKKAKKREREQAEAEAKAKATEASETATITSVTETTKTAEQVHHLPSPPPIPNQYSRSTAVVKKTFTRDEITAPSEASGGIPDPTPAYLSLSKASPSRLLRPRRILIVMDLNGTLLFRPSKRRPTHFVARPHARVFMDYLLANFAVAVWSSARPENVHRMVASLLTPAQRDRCAVIWGRDRFGLSRDDYDARVQCYKRLARVWADRDVMAAHPDAARGGRWDQTNTVLVDDSTEKARSEPHNLLCIPEFAGEGTELPLVLPQVHDYINELSHQANISQYIRSRPFALDPNYKL